MLSIVSRQVPRALETSEIPGVVEDYRKAATLAKSAGFDGTHSLL
jgi:2,4-dienoyl-CoA reductase-like NADH-dependent reductase (Old Yellow Enzyme family)